MAPLHAIAFSGFFFAMFAVLMALIARPVATRLRKWAESAPWSFSWDDVLFLSGAVPAAIFGIAVGNVLHGVPFRFDDLRRPVYDGVLLDFVLMPIVIAYTAWAFRRLRRAGLGSGRSAMTRARLLFVLPMVLGLPACAAFTGVAPTNLEPLLVGTKRADVEAVLGDPAERKPNGCGSIDTYRYNRGRRPEPAVMALGMVHPAAPLVVGLVAHPFLYYGQKADLDIVYDPNDTVIKYGPRDPADWDSLFASNHLWVDQTTAQDVAEHYHRIGVAETVNMETARTCLCHAARLGHPDPQVYLAETFGTEPGPAGGTPALALAAFETAASKDAAPSVSEMASIETGVIPHGNDGSQTSLIPAHVIAGACGVQPAKAAPSGS